MQPAPSDERTSMSVLQYLVFLKWLLYSCLIGIVVGYAVSFYALSHVFADLPLGLAYAVWTSAAVALTAVVSRIIWKEKFNGKKIAGVALIIFGVACLRMGAM